MKSVFTLALLFFTLSTLADRGPEITTKKLDLPEFHSIYVNSGYTVNLMQTNKQEVEVVALTEIYEISEFKVVDGVLHVNVERKDTNKDKSIWQQIDNIKISPEMTLNISMRDIKTLQVNGSGKIIGGNSIASGDINLSVTGSGKIDVDVKGRNLTTNISGSGEIVIKGYADKNKITLSGTGMLHAFPCELTSAHVTVSGSGLCEITVTESLDSKVLGSGTVLHKGQTKKVEKKVYGSGKVERDY